MNMGSREEPKGGVYFARTDCGRFLKIGASVHPAMRVVQLQAEAREAFGSKRVALVGVIQAENARKMKAEFHSKFAEYRCKEGRPLREWYELRGELLNFIVNSHFVKEYRSKPKKKPILRRWVRTSKIVAGSLGGITRSSNMTPEQRYEVAKLAASVRWEKSGKPQRKCKKCEFEAPTFRAIRRHMYEILPRQGKRIAH